MDDFTFATQVMMRMRVDSEHWVWRWNEFLQKGTMMEVMKGVKLETDVGVQVTPPGVLEKDNSRNCPAYMW